MGRRSEDSRRREVNESLDAIHARMVETRSSLTGKLEAVERRVKGKVAEARGKVQAARSRVRNAFDLRHQVREHPWPMMGASIAAGFMLTRLIEGRRSRSAGGGEDVGRLSWRRPSGEAAGDDGDRPRRTPLRDRFRGEIETLQRSAVEALVSLVRSMIGRSASGRP